MAHRKVTKLTLRTPRHSEGFFVNPIECGLSPDKYAHFRAIAGDTIGLERAQLDVRSTFNWGNYSIAYHLTADLVIDTADTQELHIDGQNIRMNVYYVAKFEDRGERGITEVFDLNYGEGLAIKYLLEELVKFEFIVE